MRNADTTRILTLAVFCLSAFSVLATVDATGQDGGRSDRLEPPKTANVRRPTLVKLTTDQEDVALKFAGEHHPDLAQLLEQLRKNSKNGFTRGIREVYGVSQRLERLRDKQPARFETELQNWKTYSNIRLLTAKWIMSQDPALQQQILDLLRQRQEAKLQAMRADRDKLAEKLRQLDEEIDRGTVGLDQDIQDEWDRLTKQAVNSAKSHRRNSGRPEAKPRQKPAVKETQKKKQK